MRHPSYDISNSLTCIAPTFILKKYLILVVIDKRPPCEWTLSFIRYKPTSNNVFSLTKIPKDSRYLEKLAISLNV